MNQGALKKTPYNQWIIINVRFLESQQWGLNGLYICIESKLVIIRDKNPEVPIEQQLVITHKPMLPLKGLYTCSGN